MKSNRWKSSLFMNPRILEPNCRISGIKWVEFVAQVEK